MNDIELTIQIERDTLSDGRSVYVAVCNDLGVASQGDTVGEATDNVFEAIDLFLSTASETEAKRRMPVREQSLPATNKDIFTIKAALSNGHLAHPVGA